MITHIHHIVPRHAGGSDDPSNLVSVTIEEHAELHLSLYLEHGRWQDWVAFQFLSGSHPGGWNKGHSCPEHSVAMSGEGNPMWGKEHPNKGIPRTEDVKRRISNTKKGTKFSDEWRSNISKARKGKPNRAQSFQITFEDGRIETITNMKKWCDNNPYTPGNLRLVAAGKKQQYKDIIGVVKHLNNKKYKS